MMNKNIVFVTMFGTLAGAINLIQLPIATASLSSVERLIIHRR